MAGRHITRNLAIASRSRRSRAGTQLESRLKACSHTIYHLKLGYYLREGAVAERPRDAPLCAIRNYTVEYIGPCIFLLVFHCNCISILYRLWYIQRSLEIWVRGYLGSLKMAPFDKPCIPSYQPVIVSSALSSTILAQAQPLPSSGVSLGVCHVRLLCRNG